MKYIIITNFRNKYFVVDPIAEVAGTQWRLSIPEAIADMGNPKYSRSNHTIFMSLKTYDSGEYYLTDDDYKLHSIIDSNINPELFI